MRPFFPLFVLTCLGLAVVLVWVTVGDTYIKNKKIGEQQRTQPSTRVTNYQGDTEFPKQPGTITVQPTLQLNLIFRHKIYNIAFFVPQEFTATSPSKDGSKVNFVDSQKRTVLTLEVDGKVVKGEPLITMKTRLGEVKRMQINDDPTVLFYQLTVKNKTVVIRGYTLGNIYPPSFFDAIIQTLQPLT